MGYVPTIFDEILQSNCVKIVIRALTLLKLMTLAKAALKGNDYCQLAQVARYIPEWAGIRKCIKHFLFIKVDNHDS